jgi:hypothetical protein
MRAASMSMAGDGLVMVMRADHLGLLSAAGPKQPLTNDCLRVAGLRCGDGGYGIWHVLRQELTDRSPKRPVTNDCFGVA